MSDKKIDELPQTHEQSSETTAIPSDNNTEDEEQYLKSPEILLPISPNVSGNSLASTLITKTAAAADTSSTEAKKQTKKSARKN